MASVRKRGKRWYAIIRTPGGERDRYEQALPEARNRQEAVILAGKMQSAAYGHTESTKRSSATWGRIAAQILLEREEMGDAGTRRNWIPNLRAFVRRFADEVGDMPASQVTRDHAHTYLARRKQEIDAAAKARRRYPSYSTLRKEISFLASIFDRAVQEGAASTNPWKSIKRPPEAPARDRFLSPEEFERLFSASPENRAFRWLLLAYTGARHNEALRIGWGDYDLTAGTIRVPNSKKGNPRLRSAYRVVPLAPRLAQELGRLTPGGNDDAIVDPRGTWTHDIERDWRAAGIAPVRVNDLRHTFATWAAAAGANPWKLAYMLGHASIETTQRYVTLAGLMNLAPPPGFIDFGGKTVGMTFYDEPAKIIAIVADSSDKKG